MSGNPIKKTSGHKEEDWHRLVRAEVRAGWLVPGPVPNQLWKTEDGVEARAGMCQREADGGVGLGDAMAEASLQS